MCVVCSLTWWGQSQTCFLTDTAVLPTGRACPAERGGRGREEGIGGGKGGRKEGGKGGGIGGRRIGRRKLIKVTHTFLQQFPLRAL